MRFGIKNLGPIKDANIEIGDLTIICGKNNCGKTYLSYTLFSLVDTIGANVGLELSKEQLDTFTTKGKIEIDLRSLLPQYIEKLNRTLPAFVGRLPFFLAKNTDSVEKTICECLFSEQEYNDNLLLSSLHDEPFSVTENCDIICNKKINSSIVSFILSSKSEQLPDKEVIQRRLCLWLSWILNCVFPDIFVITCERTGASLFRNEMIISREMSKEEKKNNRYVTKVSRLRQKQEFLGYPFPIKKDLEFAIHYYEESLSNSFLTQCDEGRKILTAFDDIVGGDFSVTEENIVKFSPTQSDVKLRLMESSSSIRALSELCFYLRHKATPGQILMIDEPELSLHPENQRKLARIFAMLVNIGIKVFITTHSDYIIREFNTLLMLSKNTERTAKLAERFGYSKDELLNVNSTKCYVLKEDGLTEQMNVSQKFGIDVTSFDDTIDEVNHIQQTILYGAE